MKFKRDDLRNIIDCVGKQLYTLDDGSYMQVVYADEEGAKHDITNHYVVFSHSVEGEKKFYSFCYEVSYNEGIMMDFWGAEVECAEMEAKEVTKTEYVLKK